MDTPGHKSLQHSRLLLYQRQRRRAAPGARHHSPAWSDTRSRPAASRHRRCGTRLLARRMAQKRAHLARTMRPPARRRRFPLHSQTRLQNRHARHDARHRGIPRNFVRGQRHPGYHRGILGQRLRTRIPGIRPPLCQQRRAHPRHRITLAPRTARPHQRAAHHRSELYQRLHRKPGQPQLHSRELPARA